MNTFCVERFVGAGLWVTTLLSGVACSEAGDRICSCPLERGVMVTVPSSRALDVKAITTTGACSSNVVDDDGGVYQVFPTQSGSCTITVSFRSGAAPYTDKVTFTLAACGCGPYTNHDIVVPPIVDGGA